MKRKSKQTFPTVLNQVSVWRDLAVGVRVINIVQLPSFHSLNPINAKHQETLQKKTPTKQKYKNATSLFIENPN